MAVEDSFRINAYASPPPGSVNSYWVDTPRGIVVLDAQRAISAASKLVERIKVANKPVLGIILTHAHPDHFGGLSVLAQEFPRAPIIASQAAHDSIKDDTQGLIKLSKQTLGDDFPDEVVLPTRIVKPNEEITLGGTTFRAHGIGDGEATAMMMFHVPAQRALFAGDLIQHRTVPFLLESRSAAWLKQLDEVEAAYDRNETLYPGHGGSGKVGELIEAQREYLTRFRRLVGGELRANGSITDEGKRSIVRAMEEHYPGYDTAAAIPDLLDQNVDAVAEEVRSSG